MRCDNGNEDAGAVGACQYGNRLSARKKIVLANKGDQSVKI